MPRVPPGDRGPAAGVPLVSREAQYEAAASASADGIGMTPPEAAALLRESSTGHSTPAATAMTPTAATASPMERDRARVRSVRPMESALRKAP